MKRVLSVVAVIGLFLLAGCGGSHSDVTVASGGQTADTAGSSETTTTAEPAPTTTVTEALPSTTSTTASVPSTTTTSRPATTTTTRPATTTTTKPAARTITVTTTPEGDNTKVVLKGDGCQGPDYAAGLAIRDGSGQEIDGDGGLAQPDGTWQLSESFGHYRPAGTYTFAVSCIVTNGPAVFAYAPASFVWAG